MSKELGSHGPKEGQPKRAEVKQFLLIHASYRLSQGEPAIQKALYTLANVTGGLDNIALPPDIPNNISSIKPPKRHTTRLISEDAMTADLKATWNDLVEVKGSTVDASKREAIVEEIFDGYVANDWEYVTNGRPNREPKANIKSDSEQDPHASWMRRYIIMGEKTGVPAFDALHKELRPVLIKAIDAGEVPETEIHDDDYMRQNTIAEVVKQWELHHPGESYIPE